MERKEEVTDHQREQTAGEVNATSTKPYARLMYNVA